MDRFERRFATLRAHDRAALVFYLMAGDPDPTATVPLMQALAAAGADVIELGIPFSDPMADGPVIQKAGERALAQGMTLRRVLGLVSEFRRTDATTPVLLMGYLNPIESFGYEAFCAAAAGAGVDGTLVVDMPPEEGADLVEPLRRAGLAPVLLVAPTTTDERIGLICATAAGFVYYVSVKGITGSQQPDFGALEAAVERIRRHTSLPVAVGFGIRDPDAAAQIARVSDAIVVGSALASRILAGPRDVQALCGDVRAFAGGFREAVDGARLH